MSFKIEETAYTCYAPRMIWEKFLRFATWLLPAPLPSLWLLQILPLGIFSSFLISIGPELQHDLLSAINSQAPNLYAAAHQNGIAQFPSLAVWLSNGWFIYYLLIGFCSAILAFRVPNLKILVLSAGLLVGTLLSILDLANLFLAKTFTLGDISQNILANILGGLLVGLAQTGVIIVCGYCKTALSASARFVPVITSGIMVGGGVAISAVAYYAFLTFYQPLPLSFELIAAPPFNGFYSLPKSNKSKKTITNNSQTPSDAYGNTWFPTSAFSGKTAFTGVGGMPLFTWTKSQKLSHYDVEIRFFQDCFWNKIDDVKTSGAPAYTIPDAQSVSVKLDEGLALMDSSFSDKSKFKFKPDVGTFYWFKTEGKDSFKIQHFISDSDFLEISNSATSNILFTEPLVGTNDQKAFMRNRLFNISIDGKVLEIEFEYSKERLSGKQIRVCKQINSQKFQNFKFGLIQKIKVPLGQSDAALKLSFIPKRTEGGDYFLEPDTRMKISGVKGWNSIEKVPFEDVKDEWLGSLRMLSVKGNIADLTLENVNTPVKPNDELNFIGDISIMYLTDGQIKASGTAKSLWKNDQRMNSTRWERTPNDVRLWIVGGFLALIGALLKVCSKPFLEALPRDPKAFF